VKRYRLLLLFGGRSAEHDVSVASAVSMMKALKDSDIDILPCGITREGAWKVGEEAVKMLASSALFAGDSDVRDIVPVDSQPRSVPEALSAVDVVFPLLHGPYGEDGTVQGFLELVNVPYVGSGVLGSSLSMDKIAMKKMFESEGLPITRYLGILRSDWLSDPEGIISKIESELEYPVFVKPANLGSSIGITKAKDRSSLLHALELASKYDRRLIVEQGVEARELECAVLGNDYPKASVVGEILPGDEFYTFEAKYISESSKTIIPADIPPSVSDEIRDYAVRAFKAVDAAGLARVDFFLTSENKVLVNEINTIPGFTPISMYPKLWEASGLSYPDLVRKLLDLAMERHADKQHRVIPLWEAS